MNDSTMSYSLVLLSVPAGREKDWATYKGVEETKRLMTITKDLDKPFDIADTKYMGKYTYIYICIVFLFICVVMLHILYRLEHSDGVNIVVDGRNS